MSYPTVEVSERKTVILLGGYEKKGSRGGSVRVIEEAKLKEAAKRDHDAVAFAYYFGKWIAAA